MPRGGHPCPERGEQPAVGLRRGPRSREQRDAVNDLTRRAWREGGRQHSEGRLSDAFSERSTGVPSRAWQRHRSWSWCAATGRLGLETTLPASVFPATQNLLLAAGAQGLGSAMTTLATMYADELRSVLGLPPSVQPMAVVPLGWPARPQGRPRRLPLIERVYRERYDRPW